VEGCSFWDNGHGGIELANTRHAVVRQCRFLRRDLGDGCGGNGAHFWLGPLSQFADSNLIENNIAFRTGRYGYQGPFAAISGSYNIVRHNSMVNGAGGAIALIDGGHSTIVNNACDMSASTAHGIAVFPNAARDSWHLINGNCFYADDPTGKFWYDGAIFNNLADWESAAVQTGNIDSLPGFHDPDSEDLHLLPTSACIDRGTRDSAAYEDYDGVAHPQGAGYDIGAFEFLPTGIQEQNVVRPASSATIVRDILALTPAIWGLQSEASLFDASGRRVTSLRPGPNDVSHLAPGVYFAWHGARVTKVIVNR
jgi:hypothetical protein